MNGETVRLISRPYQEIVDDVLTAIVGGVVNEPILFDIKSDFYPLSEPAQDVRGITGTRGGKPHTFLKEIDFLFSLGDNAVEWQLEGTLPDDDTVFYVDYFRRNGSSPLSDINVGSVTRTLSEAVSREISTVYEQINAAYLSAFIDTASGKSLDLVVAILGVQRKTKEFAVGLVTFFRDPNSVGNITIPENVPLSTTKGEATFQTAQLRTLQVGQLRIDVPVRATDDFRGETGKVTAGAITQMVQPIAGIARVTNFDATFLGAEDESDADLRARAKAALRSLGKATIAALTRVIFEGNGKLTELWDPNGPPTKRSVLGAVSLLIEAEPERFPSLRAAVEETRAAGVQATVIARYVFFKPRALVTIAAGLTAAGKLQVIDDIIAALQEYVDGLSSGDPAVGADLLSAIKEVDDVTDAQIVDVMAWRSDVGQPGAESLIDAVVTAVEGASADDEAALRSAITAALTETPPLTPTSNRIPDRSFVQGPSGQRATDDEIENADFKVVAEYQGEKWWVVLDVAPADIVLREKE